VRRFYRRNKDLYYALSLKIAREKQPESFGGGWVVFSWAGLYFAARGVQNIAPERALHELNMVRVFARSGVA
jgi:hypothetical protein